MTHPSSTVRRSATVACAAALLALGLTACGGSTPASTATAPTAASSPTSAPAGGSTAAGTEVKVDMTEFKLALSQTTFTPGSYTFSTLNDGKFPHTITIAGPGVDNATAGGPSKPGETGTVTVTLQAGTYQIWCPVGNHRAMGMQTSITVA